jgi:hypothetical protein
MKKAVVSSLLVPLFLGFGLFLVNLPITGQELPQVSPSLPDNVNQIFTYSCVPCHTSKGGLLSRMKLNFTEWNEYSSKKQHKKAEKIYSELKKDAMPPKSARETRPEIIPSKEQIAIIKKWSESLSTESK